MHTHTLTHIYTHRHTDTLSHIHTHILSLTNTYTLIHTNRNMRAHGHTFIAPPHKALRSSVVKNSVIILLIFNFLTTSYSLKIFRKPGQHFISGNKDQIHLRRIKMLICEDYPYNFIFAIPCLWLWAFFFKICWDNYKSLSSVSLFSTWHSLFLTRKKFITFF